MNRTWWQFRLLAVVFAVGVLVMGCDNKGGGPRVTWDPPKPVKPAIKIVNKGYEVNLVSDNVCWAEVRNAGAAGYVTFTFSDTSGYKATYRTYFDTGEGRTVRFTLPGDTSRNGARWGLSVEAD
jgi:hypothetical protein